MSDHKINADNTDVRVERNAQGVEVYLYDPYNPLNKLITDAEIHAILGEYGLGRVSLYNYELYKRAFVHPSYTKRPDAENEQNRIILAPKPEDCLPLFTKSNDRLEYVGDGILECITKYYIYCRFPKEEADFMTTKKIALVNNEAIGKIAYEMGLHKWYIMSKHAELKQTRTNFKKLGCLFEAFIGAMFRDFNRMPIQDEHGWFGNLFQSGPGFQMVQVFIECVFTKHVDWTYLIMNDDNHKNTLQVIIQKNFKVTPLYMQIANYSSETGYHMGVYLCLGKDPHTAAHHNSIPSGQFGTFQEIHEFMATEGKILVCLGEGVHKIKKKAEQLACSFAMQQDMFK